MRIEEIAKPIPRAGEVLVKIHATSVTAEEPKMRAFNHPVMLKLPVGLMFGFRKPKRQVLGIEFSGIIESLGPGVVRFQPGDEVFGYTGLSFGAYAQYKCVPENGLIHPKPKNLSFEASACMVNGPLSALAYLKKKGRVQKGDRVLIYGAAGSVGTAAVQLAKHFGAAVTGVCSTRNLELVKSLGAEVVIDRLTTDFTQTGDTYDIIFDTVGKTSMKACMKMLKPNGRYLLTEFGASHIAAAIRTSLFGGKKVIVASSNFHWTIEDLELLKQLAENHQYLPVVDRVFPLEKIADAHAYVEQGHKTGNVAISVSHEV